MKKYLITGFSGFVGQHFLEYLENRGQACLVKGLDIHEPCFGFDHLKNVIVRFEIIDLLSKDRVEYIIHDFQPDYILHLASFSSVAFSWKEPIASFINNTNILLNLLEVVRKSNLPVRILSVGSSDEYGNGNEKYLSLTEDMPLKPVSPYAVSRVSQELLSQIYVTGYGLNIVMTRSFNHIGPYQNDIFVIPSFVRQLVKLKKEGIENTELITGDISIIRDFTDVRDVVSAYYQLLMQGEKGEIYNVCSGKGWALQEVIDIICGMLNMKVCIRLDTKLFRPDDNKIVIGSNEKLKKTINWDARYSLKQSLQDMIRDWEGRI
jgi:GDP-4-dehydro-6-deoxy-D-mannose reductase